MRIAFLTCLCGRDEELYETHLRTLKKAWAGVDTAFHITGDKGDPPKRKHEFFHTWPRGGEWPLLVQDHIRNMTIVAERDDADYVCKLDVDCTHFSKNWFLEATKSRDPALIGFQMRISPSSAHGACVAIRGDVLAHLSGKRYPIAPIVRGDDIILTDLVRYVEPNNVHLIRTFSKGLNNPYRRFAGWVGEKKDYYGKFDIIHCGQPGPEDEGFNDERSKIDRILEKMEFTTNAS